MNIYFLITMLVLFFIIIVVEGLIILRKDDKKRSKGEKQVFVKAYPNENNVQYISSDKIKQLKEEKERERKLRAKKAIDEGKIKVIPSKKKDNEQEKNTVMIRVGEVQKSEKEQYNLRKDDESTGWEDDGKWWIE